MLLRKSVYPHEYMDKLPEKEEFYSNLNIEDITDVDYVHAKGVSKDSEIKNLDKYHNLQLKSDTLILKTLEKCAYNLSIRPSKFSLSPRISLTRCFKKDWSKIRIINWYWYTVTGWKMN